MRFPVDTRLYAVLATPIGDGAAAIEAIPKGKTVYVAGTFAELVTIDIDVNALIVGGSRGRAAS